MTIADSLRANPLYSPQFSEEQLGKLGKEELKNLIKRINNRFSLQMPEFDGDIGKLKSLVEKISERVFDLEWLKGLNIEKLAELQGKIQDQWFDDFINEFKDRTYEVFLLDAKAIGASLDSPGAKLYWKSWGNSPSYDARGALRCAIRIAKDKLPGSVANGQDVSLQAVKWSYAFKRMIKDKQIVISKTDKKIFEKTWTAFVNQHEIYEEQCKKTIRDSDAQARENYLDASNILGCAIYCGRDHAKKSFAMSIESEDEQRSESEESAEAESEWVELEFEAEPGMRLEAIEEAVNPLVKPLDRDGRELTHKRYFSGIFPQKAIKAVGGGLKRVATGLGGLGKKVFSRKCD